MELLTMNESNKILMKIFLYFASFVGLITGPQISILKALFVVLCLFVITGGWRFLYIVYYTAWRDLKSLIRFKKTQFYLSRLRRENATVPKLFSKIARKYPSHVMFCYDEQKWTFKQIDEFSNRIANSFLDMGFTDGDEVALFMENKPEFVGIWLGLAKAGVVTALINTNQRMDTLIHSITVVNCRALIFGSELVDAVKQVIPKLDQKRNLKYFCFGKLSSNDIKASQLENLMSKSSSSEPLSISNGKFSDRLLYIYTSGTTGMPKAAIIKHSRFIWMGAAVRNMLNMGNNEIIYTSLPLYHLAGGILGTCQCLLFPNCLVIRKKFSASNFWKDCVKYNCTTAQYIGEICRYLLAQPQRPYDTQHNVRLMFGNGLRPKIWKEFTTRFNVKQIGEIYGSTEGNANILNVDNREGSCGFISQIAPFLYPATLVRVTENGEYVRDENGICVLAKPYETGEFVGKITENDPTRAFDGYANKEATQKKIIRDVFKKGDQAFASGDLLTMDEFGYLYFKDRTGDTFRWKGENVATMEIEATISNICDLADCVVYGVEIPGYEGKAGMAAILDTNKRLDLNQFLESMKKTLPLFSIPLFIRIVDNIEATGTFKMPKNTFQRERFNPNIVKDPLFYLDISANQYLPINATVFKQIENGKIRL